MSYTHLSQAERYQIYELKLEEKTLTAIAEALGRSKSTISRELRKNVSQRSWRPLKAHEIALLRQTNSRNARCIDTAAWAEIEGYIRRDCSPEQAIHRHALETGNAPVMSIETAYQRVYADRAMGGDLITHLRGQKVYRKRYRSGTERRGTLKNRVSIDERPLVVEERSRLGDWEGDTIIGKDHQGVLVTLVERKSRFTVARQLDSKKADGVAGAIKTMLTPHKKSCYTLTFDNGKEFANHEDIAQALDTLVYFAHPYHSWERGLNENTNGLIRQYFPKKTNLRKVTQSEVQLAVNKLNYRPRKCLGYKTPHEVFFSLNVKPLKSSPVALRI